MLNQNDLLKLLKLYDRFLMCIAVAVLRHLDSNPALERRLVEFLKGKMFRISGTMSAETSGIHSLESVREQVIARVKDMQEAFEQLVVNIGGEIGRQHVNQIVVELMGSDDEYSASMAAVTLCNSSIPEAISRFNLSFMTLPSELKWISLVLLEKKWTDIYLTAFISSASESDPEIARLGIMAMSRANPVAAKETLKKLLSSTSEPIVLAVIKSLADMGASDYVSEMISKFAVTQSPKIRSAVVSALGLIKGRNSVGFLKSALRAPEPRVRANALMSLKKKAAELGSLPEDVMTEMASLKNDTDHRVQADCIQALWSLGRRDDVDKIKEMLSSQNDQFRASAAFICGKLKLHQFLTELEGLTADPFWSVRKMAAIALLSFGDSGRLFLNRIIETGTPDQQIIATFATGLLSGESNAIDKILENSQSGNEVAALATDLLQRISTPE